MSNDKGIKRVKECIEQLEKKELNIFFFVVDSKNVPNGSMQYSYQFAKTLVDLGYNVKMLYQLDNEYTDEEIEELKRKEMPLDDMRVFTGVGEWLGEEYMEIEHINIAKDEWRVGPCDFLFIPEAFSSLMQQTYQYKAPCKRIVILHNYDYITEFIPFNDQWSTYGIMDFVTNTQYHKEMVNSVFPYANGKILPPYVAPCFRMPTKPKKLIVNLISKKTEDVNKIIKQFYWKYPIYRFVTFRDLRGYSKEKYAEFLRESAITVWIDENTPFGYSGLEALKTGNILIAKVPEHIPEWAQDKEEVLKNIAVWSYDINNIPTRIAEVVEAWMHDNVPDKIYEEMSELDNVYSYDEWETNVSNLMENYINERIAELKDIVDTLNNAKK